MHQTPRVPTTTKAMVATVMSATLLAGLISTTTSYADAIEIIPKTLAENAGLDPIDIITELKNAHEKQMWAGINVFTGKTIDAFKEGIIEPLKIKTQAISSASEVAIMILRIDDVIASEKISSNRANSQAMKDYE